MLSSDQHWGFLGGNWRKIGDSVGIFIRCGKSDTLTSEVRRTYSRKEKVSEAFQNVGDFKVGRINAMSLVPLQRRIRSRRDDQEKEGCSTVKNVLGESE